VDVEEAPPVSYSLVGLGATVVTEDKSPKGSVDLAYTWAGMKDVMRKVLDEYRFADRSLRTFNGQRLPMATVQHAVVTRDWLTKTAAKMTAAAQKAGRPTTKIQTALSKYNAAFSKFKSNAKDSFNGRMPIEATYAWIDATDHFAIDLASAYWAAFNTLTPKEMLRESLMETPGGSIILGIFDAAAVATNAVVNVAQGTKYALENLSTILKIAGALGVGLVGWRIYAAKPWEALLGKKKEAPTD
jgi:hypothetical protein